MNPASHLLNSSVELIGDVEIAYFL